MLWKKKSHFISSYFRNISVRKQLFSAGALSISLLLCLCFYGITQLDAVNRQTSHLTNIDIPALQTTNTIYLVFLKLSIASNNSNYNKSAIISTIDKEFNTLLNYDLSIVEFEKLQSLQKLWKVYTANQNKSSTNIMPNIELAIIDLQNTITEEARLRAIKVGNLFSFSRQRIFILLVLGTIAICIFYYILTKRFLAPLNQGLGLVRAMQRGDLSVRINILDNNEIGTLCQALNQACVALEEKARQQSEQNEKIYQANKLISLGTLVAGVAHEINNPNSNITFNTPLLNTLLNNFLNVIEDLKINNDQLFSSNMKYLEFKDNIFGMLNTIEKSAHRIKSIIDGLRDYSKPVIEPHTFEKIDICELINTTFILIGKQLEKNIKHIDLFLPDNKIYINGNFIRLEQVLVNIINNAKEAMHDISDSVLSLSVKDDNNTVSVIVKDNGVGIDPDILSQITDPFFTTKRNINGTGLGLSVVVAILSEHNASIHFNSKVNIGTTIILTFYKDDL